MCKDPCNNCSTFSVKFNWSAERLSRADSKAAILFPQRNSYTNYLYVLQLNGDYDKEYQAGDMLYWTHINLFTSQN